MREELSLSAVSKKPSLRKPVDENDEKCARCGHVKFFHKSIFEACGRLEYCHFVDCKCLGFLKIPEQTEAS